jgi:hypothetical protein
MDASAFVMTSVADCGRPGRLREDDGNDRDRPEAPEHTTVEALQGHVILGAPDHRTLQQAVVDRAQRQTDAHEHPEEGMSVERRDDDRADPQHDADQHRSAQVRNGRYRGVDSRFHENALQLSCSDMYGT